MIERNETLHKNKKDYVHSPKARRSLTGLKTKFIEPLKDQFRDLYPIIYEVHDPLRVKSHDCPKTYEIEEPPIENTRVFIEEGCGLKRMFTLIDVGEPDFEILLFEVSDPKDTDHKLLLWGYAYIDPKTQHPMAEVEFSNTYLTISPRRPLY